MSWLSDDPQLRNAKWDWFNARNYCRKRCMDLVSIETREEYEWIKQQMGGQYRGKGFYKSFFFEDVNNYGRFRYL